MASSIADVEAGGVVSVRAFLDGLAERIRAGLYRAAAVASGSDP
jgi:hypothetical protein